MHEQVYLMKSTIFWDITPCSSSFTLVSCSAYFSTLKMEAICSSETSVETQCTTRRCIPEDGTLHNHCCWEPQILHVYLMFTTYKWATAFILGIIMWKGARSSVVGWGTMLQARRSQVRFPMSLDFFNWPNPSSHTMALVSIQPLTKMNTRNLPGGKGRPAHGADIPTAICEPIF
jgi:hypothetical protein